MGATGAAVSDATARSGATFGVQAGVAIGVHVCWAGAGGAGAGGVDSNRGAVAGGSYWGAVGGAGGADGGSAGFDGAASQVGGAGELVPKGLGGGRLVE
jgi:hypothetical protein